MGKLDQRGAAAIPVIVIILVSTSVAMATPVVVDVMDVDPDSPLYGLERLGERIRMIGEEDQMMERWREYANLVDRAKGLEYKYILREFVEKMNETVSGDTATRPDIVQWMQQQMPGMGLVRLRLMEELGEKLKEKLPELSTEIENEIGVLDDLEQEISNTAVQTSDNTQARMQLTFQHLWEIAKQHQEQISVKIDDYSDIENHLANVNTIAKVEVNITVVSPIPVIASGFEEALSELNESLAEVQAMLEGTPENTPGRNAAERLTNVCTGLKENAVSAFDENRIRKALVLTHSAQVRLSHAKAILEHAAEWEPKFAKEWTSWQEIWENLKQEWEETGTWQSILENYQQHAKQVTNLWHEQWQEKLQQTS